MDKLRTWLLQSLEAIAPFDTIKTPQKSTYDDKEIIKGSDGFLDVQKRSVRKTGFFGELLNTNGYVDSIERTTSLQKLEQLHPSLPRAFHSLILSLLDKTDTVLISGDLNLADGRINIEKARKNITETARITDLKKEATSLINEKVTRAEYCMNGTGDLYSPLGPLTQQIKAECREEYNQLIGLRNYFNTNF